MRSTKVAPAVSASAIVLILGLGCASSNTGRVLNVGVVASGAWDLHSTNVAIARGGTEANPVMGSHAWQRLGLKAVGISTVLAGAYLLEKKDHRVLAHVIRSVVMVGWSAAAIHNGSVRR